MMTAGSRGEGPAAQGERMRVLLGWTLLLAFVGVILLIATGEHVRGALPPMTGTTRSIVLALVVVVAAAFALPALTRPWTAEMDAFGPPWIAAASALLALFISVGAWSAFSLWLLGSGDTRASSPVALAVWVTAAWFACTVLWIGYLVWNRARGRALRRVLRRDPTAPGLRSFAGSIVAVPGESMLREPVHDAACVSWTVTAADEDAMPGDAAGSIGGEASAFYVVIGDTFIRVRPDGIAMVGRTSAPAPVEAVHLSDRALAERVRVRGIRMLRTSVLTVGDPVIATGVIAADAEGRLVLRAAPEVHARGALIPPASVRVRL